MISRHEGRKSCRKSSDSLKKTIYTTKDSGFESIRIQSICFFGCIQSVRIRDESGDFWHRIRPFVCKRENESGDFCASVNLAPE